MHQKLLVSKRPLESNLTLLLQTSMALPLKQSSTEIRDSPELSSEHVKSAQCLQVVKGGILMGRERSVQMEQEGGGIWQSP